MEPVVRALDVGFGHTKFVSRVDRGEVRCTHFPSVAYPTASDETTDPMGGRRKTVGIPIDGLIYEVGPDVHLAADIFNAKQMHERWGWRIATASNATQALIDVASVRIAYDADPDEPVVEGTDHRLADE